MAFLNVRLGYWMLRPNLVKKEVALHFFKESWLYLISQEIFYPDQSSEYVRLSDGGHFENLGLYELIRRKCSLIIVSDAGADPNWEFSDLSRACERIRVDFGAELRIKIDDLRPDTETRFSKAPYVIGSIRYSDNQSGKLVYLKTTLFGDLPEDILGYAKKNESFPDETTMDQFFSEEQFEAYRELGYRVGLGAVDAIH